jgi:hypothetical protein
LVDDIAASTASVRIPATATAAIVILFLFMLLPKVIREKYGGQIDKETQDNEDIIMPENSPTDPLEAFHRPQFECCYCRQCLPSQNELVAHMDEESAAARQRIYEDAV